MCNGLHVLGTGGKPQWTSSWDAPGSPSILQRSDETPAWWFAGAKYNALRPIWLCGVPGCLQQAVSPPATTSSAMGLCYRICCLETNSLRVEYIRCPSRSARLWRNTSRRLLIKDSSDLPSHRQPRVSSWIRRMGASGPVLTTALWNTRWWNSRIHFPWSRPLLRNSVGHVCFPSWICVVRIASLVSGKAMSGRRPSSLLLVTMISSLCHMALPTSTPSSRNSWTRCPGSSSTPSSSSTPRIWLTIATTLCRSFWGFASTICTSSWRSVNCIAPICISIVSSRSSAYILPHWRLCSEENRSPCPGTLMPTKPSKNSSPLSVWLPFFVIQIPMFHSWWKWTLPLPGLEPCLVCPVMSSSMSAVAQSVPCHCLLVAFRWASSCPYPFLTLVTHGNWLCDWIARVRGSHMHPSGSGSLLKGLQTNSPSQITNCPWNRWTAICSCLQKLWNTWRYCLWPGPAIYLPGMEGLLLSARGLVSLSSGYHPQMNGQAERKIQELGHYIQAYCQEDQYGWNRFLPWAKYAQNSLGQNSTGLMSFQCIFGNQPPLFPWTGEPSEVPAVDYWFRARGCGTLLTSTSSEQCRDLKALRMPGVPPLPSISQETRYGCPPRICVSDCPAVSGVPTTLARSRSRGRSTRLTTSSNYHTEIAFTSRSLFPSWNTSLLSLQNPMSQTSLLLQRSWTSHQYTRLKTSWTRSVRSHPWRRG